MRFFARVAIIVLCLFFPCRIALASEAGAPVDAAAEASDENSNPPVACDGALCDTTNGSACSLQSTRPIGASKANAWLAVLIVGLVVASGRRARRRSTPTRLLIAGGLFLFVLFDLVSTARAAESGAVDVSIHEPVLPSRSVVVSIEPIPAVAIGKWTASVLFAPAKHHALILSPFYASTNTAPIYVFNDSSIQSGAASAQLPKQNFQGFGAELGYRYYFGENGPRGFFLSPSLLVGAFTAKAADDTQTSYWNLGLAADAGYEALVGDRFAITLGAGIQGTVTTKSIPDQQFPAELYANGGIRPRLLLSFGWAF